MIWVEFVFMMLVLKIPVIYVCWLVWWAVRQVPEPPRDVVSVRVEAGGPDGSGPSPRPTRRGPHGRPRRIAHRVPGPGAARASAAAQASHASDAARRVSP
jgi:hypothetical protein